MIKGAVFDFDYTLYDRDASDRVGMTHYYTEHPELFCEGVTADRACDALVEAEHRYNYEGWGRMAQALGDWGVMHAPVDRRALTDYIQDQIARFGVAYPFVKPMLAELRTMGMRLGLITNGGEKYQREKVRGVLGLWDEFEEVLIGCDPATAKPHPDLFLQMADMLKCKPGELLYIGDNPRNDVDASRRAGYVPVWVRTIVPWRYPEVEQPPLQVDSVAEIPEIIRKLNTL